LAALVVAGLATYGATGLLLGAMDWRDLGRVSRRAKLGRR